jgi:hypothetical protein
MVKERGYRRYRFVRRYTPADLGLLAGVDELHETLSGPATQKILYREFHDYGDQRYQRLSSISVPSRRRTTGCHGKHRSAVLSKGVRVA